jgi:hypothetical protein
VGSGGGKRAKRGAAGIDVMQPMPSGQSDESHRDTLLVPSTDASNAKATTKTAKAMAVAAAKAVKATAAAAAKAAKSTTAAAAKAAKVAAASSGKVKVTAKVRKMSERERRSLAVQRKHLRQLGRHAERSARQTTAWQDDPRHKRERLSYNSAHSRTCLLSSRFESRTLPSLTSNLPGPPFALLLASPAFLFDISYLLLRHARCPSPYVSHFF